MKRVSVILILLLSACHSSTEKINIAQPLVMEPDILSAGITADPPVIDSSNLQSNASARVYNDREKPVTLHFRYYWYDKQGLEIYPGQAVQTIEVPAHGEKLVSSVANSIMATQARLYLYL